MFLSWVEFIFWTTVSWPDRLRIGLPPGPMTRFYPYPFFSDNCFVVVLVGRPFWREDGSVTYSASQSQSYIMTNSLSASPSWYQAPTWDPWPIFPILFHSHFFFFWQFRVCWCGVCTFQYWPGIASTAFFRSESHGTYEQSLLSLFFRLSQPGGPVPVFFSPRNRVAQLYPRALG
jgi:hypothetical protein